MITCRTENGNIIIEGLAIRDLDLLQEALHEAFNESREPQQKWYRTWVLEFDRAIDPVIEKEHNKLRIR